jgi:hypothetical protein
MATNRSGHKPGGGIASRVNVQPRVRTGTGSHSTRPAGVSQIGYAVGDHSTHSAKSTGYRGERLHNPSKNFQPVPFGNQVAATTVCGVGGSRTTSHCGSQGVHGSTNPGMAGRNPRGILNNE